MRALITRKILRSKDAQCNTRQRPKAILVPRTPVSFGHVVSEIPDVRNFLTSVSACVVAFNTTAHAHMLILREGEGREFIFMADRGKTSTKRSKESLIFIYAERSRIKAI